MMDLSSVIDATLVFLGVAAVLYMGNAMLSPEFLGMDMTDDTTSAQEVAAQRWSELRKVA